MNVRKRTEERGTPNQYTLFSSFTKACGMWLACQDSGYISLRQTGSLVRLPLNPCDPYASE